VREGLRERLRGVIPEEAMRLVPKSYDIIGSRVKAVAVIEIPEELRPYETDIASALMELHKNVRSILAKESGRGGEYRLRGMRLIAGDPDTEVIHREAGCLFKLDPMKVYFSPREATERGRIASKVGRGERILVMFSGVGPYPIRIAKLHREVDITAVELNPYAHNYCVENIHLNKVENRIHPILGDVKEVCPKLEGSFDRIVMPLPLGAYRFLDLAIPLLKERGVLHFYHWSREPNIFQEAELLVSETARGFGKGIEIIDRVRISQHSPRAWKVRVDARLL
jgi:tRNA (guanine37-N1)-methyltransferase